VRPTLPGFALRRSRRFGEGPLRATSGRSWNLCVDQLPGNANAVARLADATLQHVANVKLAANPFDVDSLAFLGKP
jgi:hypothetical protein